LEKNKDIIKASKIRIRLLVGDEDKLLPDVKKYDALLNSLKIVHEFKVIAGASHRYDDIFSKMLRGCKLPLFSGHSKV
jgi:esterase/lipase superfamily enzyme